MILVDIGRSPHPIADTARIVLNLGLGAFTLAVTVVVVAAYFRAYRRHRKAITEGIERRGWRGLLPRHVWLIGTAYTVLILMTMWETYDHLREPATLRIPFYAVAYAAGLWALWDVLGYEKRRIRDLSSNRSTRP
jgi:hypothetical protein